MPAPSEWTFELIDRYHEEIARVAAEYRLDTYPNQIELITAEQMMDAYASVGMPVNLPPLVVRQAFSVYGETLPPGPDGTGV